MDAVETARALLSKAHTDGGWFVGDGECFQVWADDDNETTIARMEVSGDDEHNADLIAAAPRLLRALCDEVEMLRAK